MASADSNFGALNELRGCGVEADLRALRSCSWHRWRSAAPTSPGCPARSTAAGLAGRAANGGDRCAGYAGDSLASSYLAGRIALADGDLRIAADNLGNALALDPDNLELRREVFMLRLGVGDYPAALALAESLVEIDPDAEDAAAHARVREREGGDFAAAGPA